MMVLMQMNGEKEKKFQLLELFNWYFAQVKKKKKSLIEIQSIVSNQTPHNICNLNNLCSLVDIEKLLVAVLCSVFYELP